MGTLGGSRTTVQMCYSTGMNINLALDNDLHDELRLAAFEDRRSQSEIIREAVRQWLDRREAAGKKRPDSKRKGTR